ncbi:hypothetical protein GCM10012284_54130 [Mangrovihabitans endophyticus]|uniref:Uncharacterized protein n=1 Tax=Mangrovihabitans endophyticus TaxID=1751298 RepID=A0A8J3C5A7_9ACTN|nr:hypothetical protein GCM10012284_54130 [Mangrovihabitans endophyticus]
MAQAAPVEDANESWDPVGGDADQPRADPREQTGDLLGADADRGDPNTSATRSGQARQLRS